MYSDIFRCLKSWLNFIQKSVNGLNFFPLFDSGKAIKKVGREDQDGRRESNHPQCGRFPFWDVPYNAQENSGDQIVEADGSASQLRPRPERILFRSTSRRLCPDSQLLPNGQTPLSDQCLRTSLRRRTGILGPWRQSGWHQFTTSFQTLDIVFQCLFVFSLSIK